MRISITGKLYALVGAILCGVVIVGVLLQGRQFAGMLNLISDDTRLFVTKTLFSVGGQPVRVLFLIKTFLFLVFLSLTSRLTRAVMGRVARKSARFNEHREYMISRAASFAIYIVGILIWVDVERINLGTLVILGGTLGVGFGLGLQSLVSNFVSGVILLIEQPIKLGDRIEFGDKAGEVVRVGSRSSWIRTYDNAILVVPNLELVSKSILNWTTGDPKTRVTVPVAVAYGSDSEQVMRVLVEIGRRHVDVMESPAPDVTLSTLGSNAVTFTLRVWTLIKANDFVRLRSDIYLQVIRRFSEEKIELPFPQLDLQVKAIHNGTSVPNLHEASQ